MKIFKIILSVIISYFSVSHSSGHDMSPLQNKPNFTINITAFGTAYFLELNGISIHREYDSFGQMATSFPVNHYMKPGKNSLEIYVLPDEEGIPLNKHGRVDAKLIVSPNDTPDQTIIISSINYSGKSDAPKLKVSQSSPSGQFDSSLNMTKTDKGDVTVFDIKVADVDEFAGTLYYSREINIPSTLPLWAFFNSDDLPDFERMSDEEYYAEMDILLKEYNKVQQALENKDIDTVLPMFKERNKELDQAFYNEPGTFENSIRESLTAAANNSNLELIPLERKYVDFTIEKNNKLVSLTRVGLKSAITLNFKNGEGSTRYNLIFRKQNGKWILTR